LICQQIKSYHLLERLKNASVFSFSILSKHLTFQNQHLIKWCILRVDLPEHDRNWTTALRGLVAGSIGLKAMGIFFGVLVFETFFCSR
jgi:hypothetical protein